ncbi:ribosome silencing factor [Candidatus Sneabacter namystus]|uniref:Ribosome silencing factor n=1 Tax=Candidatus Sneabacter namystus TaxID=2601646 RepID=A0A5C0UHX8_9RICK|nr:ribosome silencing factor [Candidatus Sneabacter namystus]QEK39795.1 ribosome silencing factor [Candidatus Sneabacter namystus]
MEENSILSKRHVSYAQSKPIQRETCVEKVASVVIEILEQKKALSIKVFQNHPLASYIIVAEHESARGIQAIAQHVGFALKQCSKYEIGYDGFESSKWVAIDAQDIIVHLLTNEARIEYEIENLLQQASEEINLSALMQN